MPVAAWIDENGVKVVTVSEAMLGLGGRAERPRVIEALVRLAEIGALLELPRDSQPNSARMFQRVEGPYWKLLAAETRGAGTNGSARTGGSRVG